MVETVLRAAGPYSLRLTTGASTWKARLTEARWVAAQQLADGRVVVHASCETAVDEARFMLALDDDTTEFHRLHARELHHQLLHATQRALGFGQLIQPLAGGERCGRSAQGARALGPLGHVALHHGERRLPRHRGARGAPGLRGRRR